MSRLKRFVRALFPLFFFRGTWFVRPFICTAARRRALGRPAKGWVGELSNIGPPSAGVGRTRPTLGQHRPTLAEFRGPSFAHFHQRPPNFGPQLALLAEGAKLDQPWPSVGQTRADFGRTWPNFVQHRPASAQNLAPIGQCCQDFGRTSDPGATVRHPLGNISSTLGQFRSSLGSPGSQLSRACGELP